MNTPKKFILGLLASLFLTVGLVRAAALTAPSTLTGPNDANAMAPETPCFPCSASNWTTE